MDFEFVSHDDTTKLNLAINKLSELTIPKGSYLISDTIEINNDKIYTNFIYFTNFFILSKRIILFKIQKLLI